MGEYLSGCTPRELHANLTRVCAIVWERQEIFIGPLAPTLPILTIPRVVSLANQSPFRPTLLLARASDAYGEAQ